MNCPNRDCAKVGDIIEITYKATTWFGKQIVVIPRPEKTPGVPQAGDAWIFDHIESGLPKCIRFWNYKIIKRSEKQETKNVDASLRKQMNANLRSTFE